MGRRGEEDSRQPPTAFPAVTALSPLDRFCSSAQTDKQEIRVTGIFLILQPMHLRMALSLMALGHHNVTITSCTSWFWSHHGFL